MPTPFELGEVFENKYNIDFFPPVNTKAAYEAAGWTNFLRSTETILDQSIMYIGTDANTQTLETKDYLGTETSMTIPGTLNSGGVDYAVTHIGENSFYQKSFPNSRHISFY